MAAASTRAPQTPPITAGSVTSFLPADGAGVGVTGPTGVVVVGGGDGLGPGDGVIGDDVVGDGVKPWGPGGGVVGEGVTPGLGAGVAGGLDGASVDGEGTCTRTANKEPALRVQHRAGWAQRSSTATRSSPWAGAVTTGKLALLRGCTGAQVVGRVRVESIHATRSNTYVENCSTQAS
jgi:hypothetical protein